MEVEPLFLNSEIPKIQSKAVSKFLVPIGRPSQDKLDAIIKLKQQRKASELSNLAFNLELHNQPITTSSSSKNLKEERLLQIQQEIGSITADCNNLQREQESLDQSNKLIKNEIASLNGLQGSLQWLLKKANQFETHRNHSQENLD